MSGDIHFDDGNVWIYKGPRGKKEYVFPEAGESQLPVEQDLDKAPPEEAGDGPEAWLFS